jgi:hypothetical protein
MVRSIQAFTIDHNQSGNSSPALAGTLIESLGIIPQRSSFSPSLYHTLGLPNLKSGGTMVPTAFTRRSVQLRSLGNLKYQPQCRSFQSNISTCICILDASHTKFFLKIFSQSVGIRNSIFKQHDRFTLFRIFRSSIRNTVLNCLFSLSGHRSTQKKF